MLRRHHGNGGGWKCPVMRDLLKELHLHSLAGSRVRGGLSKGCQYLHGWELMRSSHEQKMGVRSSKLKLQVICALHWARVAQQHKLPRGSWTLGRCWRQGLILLVPALRQALVSGWSHLWVCLTPRLGPCCLRVSAPNTASAAGNTPGLSSLMCHCDNREGS